MVKWKFRSCSRCDGDIFIDRDLYGWYEHCLQCGYTGDLISKVELGQQPWSERERERRDTINSPKFSLVGGGGGKRRN